MLLVHALNGRPGIGGGAAVGSSLGSWAWDRSSTWPCEDSWYSEGWAVLWGALSFSIGHATGSRMAQHCNAGGGHPVSR